MKSIVEVIKNSSDDLLTLKGATDEEICSAEDKLGLKFSDEYREYLKAFGIASWDGIELTGICKSKHQNVVDNTLYYRTNNNRVGNGLYVIRTLGIDGIVIWQNENGQIFQTAHQGEPVKCAESMMDYIQSFTGYEDELC